MKQKVVGYIVEDSRGPLCVASSHLREWKFTPILMHSSTVSIFSSREEAKRLIKNTMRFINENGMSWDRNHWIRKAVTP